MCKCIFVKVSSDGCVSEISLGSETGDLVLYRNGLLFYFLPQSDVVDLDIDLFFSFLSKLVPSILAKQCWRLKEVVS